MWLPVRLFVPLSLCLSVCLSVSVRSYLHSDASSVGPSEWITECWCDEVSLIVSTSSCLACLCNWWGCSAHFTVPPATVQTLMHSSLHLHPPSPPRHFLLLAFLTPVCQTPSAFQFLIWGGPDLRKWRPAADGCITPVSPSQTSIHPFISPPGHFLLLAALTPGCQKPPFPSRLYSISQSRGGRSWGVLMSRHPKMWPWFNGIIAN